MPSVPGAGRGGRVRTRGKKVRLFAWESDKPPNARMVAVFKEGGGGVGGGAGLKAAAFAASFRSVAAMS